MTRIYTKSGDDGSTGLIGGKRVPKDALRIEACGTIDELSAILGLACSFALPDRARRILHRVQDDLFSIGADLALPAGMERSAWGIQPITDANIRVLELELDECEAVLKPLRRFILPGGCAPAAVLHLARTVARRCERRCVTLMHAEPVDPLILRYLNRLSDLLFSLARFVNQLDGRTETHPAFGKPPTEESASDADPI